MEVNIQKEVSIKSTTLYKPNQQITNRGEK
jgi:hypothetical protein